MIPQRKISYHVGSFSFGGVFITICLNICGIGEGAAERLELVPVIAAGKDAAQGEDDD